MVNVAGRERRSGGSSRGSGFVYQKRDPNTLRERAEQKGGKYESPYKNGIDTYRPAVGDNLIRILPPTWKPHDHYGFDVWFHSWVGPDKSSYICPAKMKKGKCPICEAADAAKDAGEDDEYKALRAKRNVLVWVIDRDDKTQMPLLWQMSWSMDKDIAACAENKRTGELLVIDEPDEGYDLNFSRTGQGLNTRYNGMKVVRDSSPVHDDAKQMDKIMDFIVENPIPDILKIHDYKFLESAISGTAAKEDEDLGGRDRDDTDASERRGRGRDDDKKEQDDDTELSAKTREKLEKDANYYEEFEEDEIAEWSDKKLKAYVSKKHGAGSVPDDDKKEDEPRGRTRPRRDDSEDDEKKDEDTRKTRDRGRDREDREERGSGKAYGEDSEDRKPRGRRDDPEDDEKTEKSDRRSRREEPEEERSSDRRGRRGSEDEEKSSRRGSRDDADDSVDEEKEERSSDRRSGREDRSERRERTRPTR